MKTRAAPPQSYDFVFPRLDTLVRVEQREEIVFIRATRDTFSPARKESFVRELAAEGFIADSYRWFLLDGAHPSRPLRWLIDVSWLKPDSEQAAITRRFIFRLFGVAGLLWLSLMVMLLVRAAG